MCPLRPIKEPVSLSAAAPDLLDVFVLSFPSAALRAHFSPSYSDPRSKMPLGLIRGLGRAMRRKRTSSLNILSSKRGPRDYYKGKNCKPTGFHTRKAEALCITVPKRCNCNFLGRLGRVC
uniref:Uncharacterized protein LOC105058712 isoform X2 n=1 Tax=Elaeis guineensis var. tenera TaxID=51953 RepID=A0A8N4FAM6_ELAGV|nr:uncharacterized protein LOC105058712 isoform X2 [Elaeis guineensis]